MLIVFSSSSIKAQNVTFNFAWIKEEYVKSIDIINDTINEEVYLDPILGFSNLFKSDFGIKILRGDEIKIPKNSYKILNKSTIRIGSFIGGFLTTKYLEVNKVKNDKNIYSILELKNNVLHFRLYYGKKLIKEYTYLNHYNDYYFYNLRESYYHLYNLKHNKK